MELDVSQAIPLGLIVTESIVNAIKYAFINEEKGLVIISLHEAGTDASDMQAEPSITFVCELGTACGLLDEKLSP